MTHRIRLLVLAAAALCGGTHAQGLSGSESVASTGRVLSSAGGDSSSDSFHAQVAIGTFATPDASPMSSESFHLAVGITNVDSELSHPGMPIVFGTLPAHGSAQGGSPLRVFGFNLDDATGLTPLAIGNASQIQATPGANTWIDMTTPPGMNQHGNPLGRVMVAAETIHGSAEAEAFTYGPALEQVEPATVGQDFRVRLASQVPVFHQLFFGGTVEGLSLPFEPLEGALELLVPLKSITSLEHDDDGEVHYTLTVPANPAFAGGTIELQAFVLTSVDPLAGSFTNVLPVTMVPAL